MKAYESPDYDDCRNWIRNARNRGWKWDTIRYAGTSSENGLKDFLEMNKAQNFWKDDLDCKDWYEIVTRQKSAEQRTRVNRFISGQALIKSEGADNTVSVPTDPDSSWQLYRKKLEEKNFDKETIDTLEESVLKILRRLSSNTRYIDPVKGLVIGNVQSGKTANMAGLMAMAADWGWNVFIILSGTIENLRIQTQNRIFTDLNSPGNLIWRSLNHPSLKSPQGDRAQDLDLSENSRQRYMIICLKNSKRLNNLLQWMTFCPEKQRQMKVLLIDDEADQASIDTLDIMEDEQTAINKCITDIVNGINTRGVPDEEKCLAMNYVGYTATPYANVLNDASPESLYPRNFISTLSVSKEYFGPQQIFGGSDGYEGLDIVRTVSKEDLRNIGKIHGGSSQQIPDSLKDSLCWFICAVCAMRLWHYKKPVSMLIHTSQSTKHHENMAKAISRWFDTTPDDRIIDRCERIWNYETGRFGKKQLREQYSDYKRPDNLINDYPDFEELREEAEKIIRKKLKPIMLDDDGKLTYHQGIHLCVDNCQNNRDSDGMHMRLAYPDKDHMPCEAPAFVVIGGTTLARGLTIEGLVSTYFLRTVRQADTLMQMGRWFGYRKGYELLPRIWMTDGTVRKYQYLSVLDQYLRDEIVDMDVRNISPSEYGPKLLNSPNRLISITSKNKMQSATPCDMDYTGSFNQTYLFDTDKDILQKNLSVTEDFINRLGEPETPDQRNPFAAKNAIWRDVPFSEIENYLRSYHFQKNLHFGQNIDSYLEWIGKITEKGLLKNWDVILSNGGEIQHGMPVYSFQHCSAGKVRRSRKKVRGTEMPDPAVIDIGALRDPRDIVSDVQLQDSDIDLIRQLEHFKSGQAKIIRNKNGMDNVPQLIVYIVDAASKAVSAQRTDLNAPTDLAGICVNIPGGQKNADYVATVSVRLTDDNTDNTDLEDTDGN